MKKKIIIWILGLILLSSFVSAVYCDDYTGSDIVYCDDLEANADGWNFTVGGDGAAGRYESSALGDSWLVRVLAGSAGNQRSVGKSKRWNSQTTSFTVSFKVALAQPNEYYHYIYVGNWSDTQWGFSFKTTSGGGYGCTGDDFCYDNQSSTVSTGIKVSNIANITIEIYNDTINNYALANVYLNYTGTGDTPLVTNLRSAVTGKDVQIQDIRVIELSGYGWNNYQNIDDILVINTSLPQDLIVDLVSPSNNSIDNQAINFIYNITSINPLSNCSLWLNNSGVWQLNSTNSSSVINGSNNITVSLSEGDWLWNVECYDNNTNTFADNNFTLTIDTTNPYVSSQGIQAISMINESPVNLTWSLLASDPNIDSCWYWSNENITNTTVTCNNTIYTTWSNESYKTIYFCANDTAGNQECSDNTFYVHNLSWLQNQSNELVGVGDQTLFILQLNMTTIGVNWTETNATLNLGNAAYNPTKYTYTNYIEFRYTHTWTNSTGNSSGIVYNWNWSFFVQNQSFILLNYTTTNGNVTVTDLEIDGCTNFTELILNYTLYDETSKSATGLSNTSIELDITITKGSLSWTYNTSGTTQVDVCLPLGVLNTSSIYYLYSIAKYSALDHAVEYHYMDMVNLSPSNPINVNLYTLNTDTTESEYSTSFIVNYQDARYLPVEGAVIDLLRYYVSDGNYVSIEHGKTDEDGNTRLHFVTEDVKYKVVVRKNNEVQFQSSEFLALCQLVPCLINFEEQSAINQVGNYTQEENLNYQITLDEDARTVTASFSTIDGSSSTFGLRLTRFDAYNNDTVCNDELTTSGGSLTCSVPTAARNSTYVVEFYTRNSPENWVAVRFFDLNPHALDTFGNSGIIMTVFLYLTLVFMAIPSGGIAVIVFGLIGLVVASLLVIFTAGNIFGTGSALLWLIIAGTIIIYKASKRNG